MKSFLKQIFLSQIILAFVFFLVLSTGTLATANEEVPEVLTIGIIPGGNPDQVKKESIELASELQSALGIKVNIYISKDYNTLIEAMKEKKVDFAFLTALSFVYAEKTAQAKVLLKKIYNEPFYFSALVTSNKSKIKRFVDLKGKIIAFVDAKSTSGYLYPKAQLKKINFNDSDFKSIIFSGNHSNSVKLLEEGKVDVIAVFSDDAKGKNGAWTKFSKEKKFKVLWVSSPIPTDPFTVRQDFYTKYPNVVHSVMVNLVDLFEKSKMQKKYREILGEKELMPATSKQYDPVREVIKNLDIEIK